MKFVIETGSGSHTTSSARLQAKYHGGPNDGKYLYEVKANQIKANWLDSKKGERWVETQYELPEGTEIEIEGHGRTGARGADHDDFHRIYRLDSKAEVLDLEIKVGLRICYAKGRMTLVKDVLIAKAQSAKIDTDEGF